MWGKQVYGEWLILSTIPAYLATSDMGFGIAAANEMGLCVGRNDFDAAIVCFQTVWVMITSISLILTTVVISAVQFLPIRQWVHITSMSSHETVVVASMLTATVICNQQAGIVLGGFKCTGNYAAGTMWVNAQRLFEFLAIIIVAALGYRPPVAACAMLVVGVVVRILMHRSLRKKAPWLTIGLNHFRRECLMRLWRPAISYLGLPLGAAFRYQGMASVVSVGFGPVALVGFSTIRTLCNVPMQLSVCIGNAVWPELSVTFGRNDVPLARKLHRHACQASILLSILMITGLAITGPYVIRIWTNNRVQLDRGLFFGFLAMVGINSLWNTSAIVPTSANKHYRITAFVLGLNAVAVFAAPLLAAHEGIGAIAWLLCGVDVILLMITLRASLKLLGEDAYAFIRAMMTVPTALLRPLELYRGAGVATRIPQKQDLELSGELETIS
jgi:O-antigen/teichoic acid export membrane protein